MDLNHHEAQEALAAWVPQLERLIALGYSGEAAKEVRGIADDLITVLLAQAGRQASLPAVPFPERVLDEIHQAIGGFGDREYLGHSLREPGSTYQGQESHMDSVLALYSHGGLAPIASQLRMENLQPPVHARIALRLWGGAVAHLASYEAIGGSENLRRALWWLSKAAMAWEVVKTPDYAMLQRRARERLKERFSLYISELDPNRVIFGRRVLDEIAVLEMTGWGGPTVVSFPVDTVNGDEREVVALTPTMLAHAAAADAVGRNIYHYPSLGLDGTETGRMASWIGMLIKREIEAIHEAGVGYMGVHDWDVLEFMADADPDGNGVYPLGDRAKGGA